MGDLIRVFVDTSKSHFQLHGVDRSERVVLRRPLTRSQLLGFFVKLEPTVVGLEACGASHHWARELAKLGHEVVLLAPQHVKRYLKRGKNDARDAEAGCEAMSRPHMEFVRVKSAEEQADLMLMGLREAAVAERTRVTNMIRGHAAEFGLVGPCGLDAIGPLLKRIAGDPQVPERARVLFARLGETVERLEAEIDRFDRELKAWVRSNEAARRLIAVPGLGPIGAALLVMKAPDPKAFRSARHFAAWLGLTPKDHSTAGKERHGVITRAGDERLRATLVVGAMAVVKQALAGRTGRVPGWLVALVARKKPKLAAVAYANKLARIAWKLMVSGEAYRPGTAERRPAGHLAAMAA